MIVKSVIVAGLVFGSSGCFDQVLAQHMINGHNYRYTAEEVKEAAKFVHKIPNLHLAKEIPLNFSIPPYTSNVVRKSFANSTGKAPTSAAVNIITKDSPKVAFDWYVDICKRGKWIVKVPTAKLMQQIGKTGQFYMLDADKDREHLSIFCLADPDSRGTSINISWSLKRKTM